MTSSDMMSSVIRTLQMKVSALVYWMLKTVWSCVVLIKNYRQIKMACFWSNFELSKNSIRYTCLKLSRCSIILTTGTQISSFSPNKKFKVFEWIEFICTMGLYESRQMGLITNESLGIQAQNYFFVNSGFMACQSWFQMCYESMLQSFFSCKIHVVYEISAINHQF